MIERLAKAATALGVRPEASRDEVRKAFHKVALRCHPDKVSVVHKETASVQFSEAQEAYELLLSGTLRGATTTATSNAAGNTASSLASGTADRATNNVTGGGVRHAAASMTMLPACTDCNSVDKLMWMGGGIFLCARCNQRTQDNIRSTSPKEDRQRKRNVQRRSKEGRLKDRHRKRHAR